MIYLILYEVVPPRHSIHLQLLRTLLARRQQIVAPPVQKSFLAPVAHVHEKMIQGGINARHWLTIATWKRYASPL